MRKLREVLGLYFAAALSIRAIARSLETSPSTVGEYLRRANAAGVSWPVPEAIDDAGLERRLFPALPCSTPWLRHRRTKRLASAGLVRPMKASYWERRNTPLCRQTNASHSASRRVHPRAISAAARSSRWAIISRHQGRCGAAVSRPPPT